MPKPTKPSSTEELADQVRTFLDTATPKEREIFAVRFGIGTPDGKSFPKTNAKIAAIVKRAMAALHNKT
ncbi:MAG: hypothetical protein WC052_01340 [Patescibacteria group bacterium]